MTIKSRSSIVQRAIRIRRPAVGSTKLLITSGDCNGKLISVINLSLYDKHADMLRNKSTGDYGVGPAASAVFPIVDSALVPSGR